MYIRTNPFGMTDIYPFADDESGTWSWSVYVSPEGIIFSNGTPHDIDAIRKKIAAYEKAIEIAEECLRKVEGKS